ncbi:hypothetical protein [Dactylosporangium sp. CA-139066]|uniref:VG15 protein n=1 Tax=Dactylosporangium sp. CA-139066 TaxID=3239930 RepID=UPI003D8CD193
MAVTPEGAALTRDYVRGQLALTKSVITDIQAVWPMLDPKALDASFPRYFTSARAIVLDARHSMESLTSRYYTAFRAAEGATGLEPLVELAQLEAERLLTALVVTGPSAVKTAVRDGVDLDRAMRFGFTAQAGAASRLALDAGRDRLDRSVRADDAALGWHRVTSGKACYFCAMLASRGAVYKTARSAGRDHRYHDHCACTQEPMFSRKSAMTPEAERYRALWDQSTQGKSGAEAVNAFRLALESQ